MDFINLRAAHMQSESVSMTFLYLKNSILKNHANHRKAVQVIVKCVEAPQNLLTGGTLP